MMVIGIGNRDRGDDAVGPAVADAMRSRGVPAFVAEGDLSDLALRWSGDDHVVIVDAAVTGAEPGTVHVLDGAGRVPSRAGWSTHGIGLGDAIGLARVLDRMPARLTVIAVEAGGFDDLAPLSAPVAAAVDRVADTIVLMVDE